MTQSWPKDDNMAACQKSDNLPEKVVSSKVTKSDDLLEKDRPWLDNVLTVAFVGFMIHTVYFLIKRKALQEVTELIVSFLAVSVLIWLCKAGFALLFDALASPQATRCRTNKRKFADQSWQLAIHVSMTLYGILVLEPWDWLRDTSLCYQGPGGAPGTVPDIWLERLYIIQSAIWAYTAFSHRWVEARHKDYFVMFTHHVVTIMLISLSWALNLKFGALVLLIHDASDIGVDLLKMSNYAGRGLEAGGLPFTEVIFVTALVVWIYLRLWVYPTTLLKSAFYESHLVCEDIGVNCSYMRLAMVVLQLMHIWWTYLLIRILVRGITHDSGRDVYEGPSDTDDKKS